VVTALVACHGDVDVDHGDDGVWRRQPPTRSRQKRARDRKTVVN
jgi:hypothetical protein